MKKIFSILVTFCFLQIISYTQVYVPLNFMQAIKNETRTFTGEPGKKYWQNSADYNLKIKFNPNTRFVEGSETITYYNNSPDTLNRLVIQLLPDYYKKGMTREWPVDGKDENNGVTIKQISINNSTDIQNFNEGTNYIALPSQVILPHSKATVKIEWNYVVPKGSPNRTGLVDETTFFMAYTFPRIAVYDDIDGWNMHSYNGLQEFYNDFGNFDAEISVPKNYVVWATGNLLNANEVFTQKIQDNLNAVMQSDSIVYIINKQDAEQKKVTEQNKWNTFKFNAANVTDFAFALSNHYVWQASSLNVSTDAKKENRVRIDAVYNPAHTSYERVAKIARQSIELMGSEFPRVPYPYPHETVFDGLDQMEYPMMVNDNPVEDYKEDIELTSHEIFHTYFPFYMGINETKYAWMDEGWATAAEGIITQKILNEKQNEVFLSDLYQSMAGKDVDVPLITLSTLENDNTYWGESYGKPALTYLYMREMLGDDLFFKALQYYINTWQGKHPAPYDFFNSINTGSGKNLNWFFNAWYYLPGYPDVAIMNIYETQNNNYTIVLASLGNKPVPVDLTVTFTDNTTKNFRYSANIWESNTIYYVNVASNVKIKKAELSRINIPDVNSENNVWQK